MNRWIAGLLAALCGVAAGLAHPPFGLLPGLLGYAGLLALLDRASPERPMRSAFWRGWCAAFGYFVVSTWWVGEAFLVDAAAHGWMAPFAVSVLPAGLALLWGTAAVLYRRFAPPGAQRVLVFAAAFGLLEWVRGHILTGFPWNLPGQTWAAGGAVSQNAAWLGAYGLTVLTLAIAAAPAVRLTRRRPARTSVAAVGVAAAVLAGLYGWGAYRLEPAALTPLRVRVVQANVDQKDKWRPENLDRIIADYVALSTRPGAEPDVIIWPEGALPAAMNTVLSPGFASGAVLAEALRPGQTLMMGGFRVAGTYDDPLYYSSLFYLWRDQGALAGAAVFDKHRLVPFGEYLPLEDLLEPLGVKKLVAVGDGFTPGPPPRPVTLRRPRLPLVQPLICYESLFPGFTGRAGPRPAWIVNISNDAWFGATSGPWQHLNLASYRAIEQGLPIVRSTPTGVSAVVDPYGRIKPGQRLPIGAAGIIDAHLPAALPRTFYARWGEIPFWVLTILGGAAALVRRPVRGKFGDS
jgi:apolipoprotein N-acyltransferase